MPRAQYTTVYCPSRRHALETGQREARAQLAAWAQSGCTACAAEDAKAAEATELAAIDKLFERDDIAWRAR